MRLNLPRHNCISFSVFSEFTAPKEKGAEIQAFMERTLTSFMDRTLTSFDDDGDTLAAFYGSISRAGGIAHRVSATLAKQPSYGDRSDVSLMVVSERDEEVVPPPREMRSVNDLIEVASDLFGPVEVSCNASFEYERELGFASKIHFPVPMIVQDDADGITHIESARFSRRDAEGVRYWIEVAESDDGAEITHSVDFATAVSLDQDRIRALFNNAVSISSRLIATA